jgi:hypothetical protein
VVLGGRSGNIGFIKSVGCKFEARANILLILIKKMEIDKNRRLQILFERLIMVEDKIKILGRRVVQLQQEMNTTSEDVDPSGGSSGLDAEIVQQAGI